MRNPTNLGRVTLSQNATLSPLQGLQSTDKASDDHEVVRGPATH